MIFALRLVFTGLGYLFFHFIVQLSVLSLVLFHIITQRLYALSVINIVRIAKIEGMVEIICIGTLVISIARHSIWPYQTYVFSIKQSPVTLAKMTVQANRRTIPDKKLHRNFITIIPFSNVHFSRKLKLESILGEPKFCQGLLKNGSRISPLRTPGRPVSQGFTGLQSF